MPEFGDPSIEKRFTEPDQLSWNLEKDIHVWKFPVLNAGLSLLTFPEQEIANRFRREADKNRFITGRKAIRLLLSKYLSLRPTDIVITAEDGQKPCFNHPSSQIHFNISHSGDWVLIALGPDELGIDIEKMDPEFDFKNLLEEYLNETEKTFISGVPDPVAAFYFLWTRKEALIKAWGMGFPENLKTVSVLGEYSLYNLQQKNWKLESFNISVNYSAALAYPGNLENIIYLDGSHYFEKKEFI